MLYLTETCQLLKGIHFQLKAPAKTSPTPFKDTTSYYTGILARRLQKCKKNITLEIFGLCLICNYNLYYLEWTSSPVHHFRSMW